MKTSKPVSTPPTLRNLQKAVVAAADPIRAVGLARFFKTAKGEYAEGDRFRGLMVPLLRRLAREYRDLPLADVERLLQSPYNEERALALMILIAQYAKVGAREKKAIFQIYFRNRHFVNNWNLVDLSAPYLAGAYLAGSDRSLLYKLARSPALWDRRIAIVATLFFIRKNDLADTFGLVEILLTDKHDLMHKACGWMLREAGKRNQPALEKFLHRHASVMPRTMLRYAIERFPQETRAVYLTMRLSARISPSS